MMTATELKEKLDILTYMAENDYPFGAKTFDFYVNAFTVDDLRYLLTKWVGEDPTA
jgi:hypothetical protein